MTYNVFGGTLNPTLLLYIIFKSSLHVFCVDSLCRHVTSEYYLSHASSCLSYCCSATYFLTTLDKLLKYSKHS